jgi:hypothetical protein
MAHRVACLLVILFAGALRFYGLGWGAPYFHFHIDEHFVFVGADLLRISMRAAATSVKFFMYGPAPMHLLNGLRWVHDRLWGPLDLSTFDGQVTYMLLGRAISAAMGTATVAVVYLIARRISTRSGGLVAAFLLAATVVHIAESHTFRVDLAMVFFAVVTWWLALRIVDEGRRIDYVWAGIMAGAAIGSKYAAVFSLGVIAIAHLLGPVRPRTLKPIRPWIVWTGLGLTTLVVAAIVFIVINPMTVIYSGKFVADIREWVVDPLTGVSRPIWIAQFADVQPQLYWLTNLWWGLGPAFECWGLLGFAWILVRRRDRAAMVSLGFPALYLLGAGGTIAPFSRYILPLAPAFAVAAGVLSGDLLEDPRTRNVARVFTGIVLATTAFYGLAYMNIYRAKDARLEASAYLTAHVPAGAHILVEPSHSIPPTGAYLRNPNFHGDHVLWGAKREQHDYYGLYTLDTYVYLYNRRATPEQKQEYIASRLALVDYIVIDDFYVQLYGHLSDAEHGVVRQYYRDLFSGALGFDLLATFKVYPSLWGITVNDDRAELSSRMNDHPRVYVFRRRVRRVASAAATAGSLSQSQP